MRDQFKLLDKELAAIMSPKVTERQESMTFTPNRRFKRDYDRLFQKNPVAANLLLLLSELSDEQGRVYFSSMPEVEIQKLLLARFDDPMAYQLTKGSKI